MDIGSIGEFGLIERIRKITETHNPDSNLLLSIGDDAAAYIPPKNRITVITTDTMAEDVHFDLSYTTFFEVGWRAGVSNLSDIAAMGAEPGYAVVNIGIPEKWTVENIEEIYRGMTESMSLSGCVIIGGDCVKSKSKGFISITVTGFAEKNLLAKRSEAKPGDSVFVTGSLGGSRAGFEILSKNRDQTDYKKSVNKFLKPLPRIKEAGELVKNFNVRCMIDISDGLSSEIGHICTQSDTGAEINGDKVPVHPEAKIFAEKNNYDPLTYALASGEEYELLFTASPENSEKLIKSDFAGDVCPVTKIGFITDKKGIFVRIKDNKVPIAERGWNHFS